AARTPEPPAAAPSARPDIADANRPAENPGNGGAGYNPPRLSTRAMRKSTAQEYNKITRDAFDNLPAAQQQRVLADLRRIADSGDTTSGRDGLGISYRGKADHVDTASALLRRFTEARRAPVDNSPAGRAGRIRAATSDYEVREALFRASKADMETIAQELGLYGGTSSGWRSDKWVDHLVAGAARQRAEREAASRGGDRTPAAAVPASAKKSPAAPATARRPARATELAIDGTERAFVPADRSTIGVAARPEVGRRKPADTQLGLFADDKKEMAGQGALLDALNQIPAPPPAGPRRRTVVKTARGWAVVDGDGKTVAVYRTKDAAEHEREQLRKRDKTVTR
ncbi:hypothetical protein AB0O64_37885, partial [Streptomyces sp. NPDC088341]